MHTNTRTDRWRWHLLTFATALLLQLAALTTAHANDTRMRVNTSSGVYHCPGTRYYGATKRSRYASEA